MGKYGRKNYISLLLPAKLRICFQIRSRKIIVFYPCYSYSIVVPPCTLYIGIFKSQGLQTQSFLGGTQKFYERTQSFPGNTQVLRENTKAVIYKKSFFTFPPPHHPFRAPYEHNTKQYSYCTPLAQTGSIPMGMYDLIKCVAHHEYNVT